MSTEENKNEEVEVDQLTEIVKQLSGIAETLGFNLAIPKPKNEDDPIQGFIIGTPEYIEEITAAHAKLTGQENNEGDTLEDDNG